MLCAFFALLGGCVFGALGTAVAQDQPCDPALKRVSDSSVNYRLRCDRCEGVYSQSVATTSLHVASFTSFAETLDLSAGKTLLVGWTFPTAGTVRVRAEVMRYQLNYRMDTAQPALSRSYVWQTDMLAQFAVKQSELGVSARLSYPVLGKNEDVYIPVTLTQRAQPSKSTSLKITLIPGAELSRVSVSFRPIVDGKLGPFIFKNQQRKETYFAAYQPFVVEIQPPRTGGIYLLQVGALLRVGGSTSINVWFYNPA
jgi:hypothetical protein